MTKVFDQRRVCAAALAALGTDSAADRAANDLSRDMYRVISAFYRQLNQTFRGEGSDDSAQKVIITLWQHILRARRLAAELTCELPTLDVVLAAAESWQCPGVKTAIESGDPRQKMAATVVKLSSWPYWRRVAVNQLRQDAKDGHGVAQLDPMVAEALPDDRNQRALTEVETRVDLEPVMNQFDTRTRALLRMVMAGWSDSEIARAINVDRSTVGRRLRRLRLMFPWLE